MKLSAEGKLRLAVKLAFIAGVGTVVDSAYAQTSGGQATQLTGVQVTGSRIKQQNLTQSSSVLGISDKELQYEGTTNVESLVNSMPQVYAGFSSADSNGATGTATVNLRGLGPQETLVLIDGKRLMPGDPLQTPPSADLNFIPAALVDRIDILSGGASAVYGSDAVAGVVNFIMKKDFQGFRLDGELSRTDHSDGTTYDYTMVWGNNFSGGKGNVTLYAGYTRAQAVTQAQRGYSACSLATNKTGTSRHCAGSGVIPKGRFESYDRLNYNAANGLKPTDPKYLQPYFVLNSTPGTQEFLPDDGSLFNFAPYNYIQRPDSRYHLGGFAHDQLNKHVDVYGSAMFMDNHTVAAVAPTGLFGNVAAIPCNNPLLSGLGQGPIDPATGNHSNIGEAAYLCGDNSPSNVTPAGAYPDDLTNGTGVANVAVLKRLVELGPRISDLRHTDYRLVVGARGDIVDGLSYDAYAQHGAVIFASGTLNYVNTANALAALNAIPDGAGGAVCAPGAPKGCVPLDLFKPGGIDQAQIDFIKANGFSQATQLEDVANTTLTADLGKYGVKSPLAKNGIGLAGGYEFRRESLDYRPDSLIAAGSLGGVGGPSPAVAGGFNTNELFGEVQAPIIEDMPGAKLLQVDGAYRWSNYSSGANDVHSWKGGFKYSPIKDVTLRGSFQRATRAPAVTELFAPSAFGLNGGSDPCSGSTPSASLTQCMLTGVTAGQYGHVGDCLAGQCNIQTGGFSDLKSELSITRSLGIILTPIRNTSFTVDYFDIYIDGAIGIQAISSLFSECFNGLTSVCNGFHRGPSGRLSGDTSVGNYVEDFEANTGSLRTKGVDFQADYRARLRDWGMGNNGQLVFNYVATWVEDYSLENSVGQGLYNCAGLYGTVCNGTSNGPNPRYRHKARMTWDSPFGLSLSVNWRFLSGVHLDQNTGDPNLNPNLKAGVNTKPDFVDDHIGSKQYVDLAGTYLLPIPKQNITMRFGITNVGGQNPPVVSSNNPFPISSPPFGNGNTFPNVYDSLGRVLFVGLTADF